LKKVLSDNVPPVSNPWELEDKLGKEGFQRIMGLDEVGRGCLAGPVVAAGVVLGSDSAITGIADSKKLSANKRVAAAELIKRHAVCWTIAWCTNDEIDTLNILKASLKAMARCVEKASPRPDFLLIDGNKPIDGMLVRSETVVRGDNRSVSIGAASILAKVYRDALMTNLHQQYPEFGWDKNVGYPTARHYEALHRYGFTPFHRQSFRLGTSTPYQNNR